MGGDELEVSEKGMVQDPWVNPVTETSEAGRPSPCFPRGRDRRSRLESPPESTSFRRVLRKSGGLGLMCQM